MPTHQVQALHLLESFLTSLEQGPPEQRTQRIDAFCSDHPHLADGLQRILELMDHDHEDWEPPACWPAGWFDPGLPPGTRVGAYAIQNCLGVGGMGIVYRAQRADGSYQQDVAIKVLAPTYSDAAVQQHFLQERHLLASLNHPGIARILDAGILPQGEPYFVMELVDGIPIDQYCDQKKLSVQKRIELFQQVLAALTHAHQRRVVHSDLKPAHLLVNAEGNVKIIDFGIARRETQGTPQQSLRLTPAYASPEQIRGEPLTTATDTYSASAVLFELLVGQSPFDFADCDLSQALERVIHSQPRSAASVMDVLAPSELHEIAAARACTTKAFQKLLRGEIQAVLDKGLAKDPAQRYDSARILAGDLESYLTHKPLSCVPASKTYWVRKFAQRHPVGTQLFAICVFGVMVLLGLWLAQVRQTYREKANAEENLAFLFTVFDQAQVEQSGMAHESALDLLNRSALALRYSKVEPHQKSRILDLLSQLYRQMGQPEPGQHIAQEALALKMSLGFEQAEMIPNYTDLGQLSLQAGHWDSGMNYLKTALRLAEQNPSDPTALLMALQIMGYGYQLSGQTDEAKACYQNMLSSVQRTDPKTSEICERATLNLSWLLMEEGEIDAARPLLESTLTSRQERYGALHPSTLRAREAWAQYLYLKGELVPAFHYVQHLIADVESAYRDFPGLAHPPMLLGSELAMAVGEPQQAESWLQSGLARSETRSATHFFDRIPMLNQQALYLAEQSEFDQAQTVISQAMVLANQPEIPGRFQNLCLRTRAEIYQRQGQLDASNKDYQTLFSRRSTCPWSIGEWLRAETEYGWLLVRLGRSREAVELYEHNLSANPDMAVSTRMNSLHNLGWAYYLSGQRDDGIASFRAALAQKSAVFGLDHPSVALTQHSLAWCLYETEELEEAMILSEQALATRAQRLGVQHPEYAWSLHNHAMYLFKKGDRTEAINCMKQAFNIRENVLGSEHPQTLQSMASLMALEAKQEAYEEAFQLGRRLYPIYEKHQPSQCMALAQSLVAWGKITRQPDIAYWQETLRLLQSSQPKD
ncbi:MAG: tetratricopeptide repeat protein [Acidobacteria bacterium]|nr:tetratricopeptide repeat protein [Acidobacteriota bacterium]